MTIFTRDNKCCCWVTEQHAHVQVKQLTWKFANGMVDEKQYATELVRLVGIDMLRRLDNCFNIQLNQLCDSPSEQII